MIIYVYTELEDLLCLYSRGQGFRSTIRELFVGEYLTIICQRDSGKLLCAVIYSGKQLSSHPFCPLSYGYFISLVRLLKFLREY